MRKILIVGCVAALAVTPALAGQTKAKPKKPAKPAASSAAEVTKGKELVAQFRCNSCHGADLAGKKGFSPSLRASGVLKEYNPTTWARVLDTGVTNDNGKVKQPMPVYHMKAADAKALWAYLKTQK